MARQTQADKEAALRAEAERRYPTDFVEAVWNDLVEKRFVADALEFSNGKEVLFEQLARDFGLWRGQKISWTRPTTAGARTDRPMSIPLARDERRRLRAMDRAIRDEASSDPAVWRFRERFVPRPMSMDQATGFVWSPAATTFEPQDFERIVIPALSWGSTFYRQEEARQGDRWRCNWVVRINEDGSLHTRTAVAPALAGTGRPARFPWFTAGGMGDGAPFLPASIVGNLYDIAVSLSRRFPWRPREAAKFVLTGNTGIEAVEVRVGRIGHPARMSRGRIALLVEPWVPDETVRQAYREQQRDMLRGEQNKTGKNVPVDSHKLDVFEFVTEHRAWTGRRLEFRELARLWNLNPSLPPEWRYPTEPPDALAKFGTAYNDARRRLLQPQYSLVGDTTTRKRPAEHENSEYWVRIQNFPQPWGIDPEEDPWWYHGGEDEGGPAIDEH